jgi:formamidopyrimidine-DNA glycosylase
MPELPEVEVVRAGLENLVLGSQIGAVRIHHERAVRHNVGDLTQQLEDATIVRVARRGKYMWLELDRPFVLMIHLGMSGQIRVNESPSMHPHVRLDWNVIRPGEPTRFFEFVDQRTFGGLRISDQDHKGEPSAISHIAKDPFDPMFDVDQFADSLVKRSTQVKRALLDQHLISGIGNIYADECLWRVGLDGTTPCDRLDRLSAVKIVMAVTQVMNEALVAGGTSFDSLYVNVNGESGYFSRSLSVYGREGAPCERCGNPITRSRFMNRSSFHCLTCQPSWSLPE